MIDWHLQKEYDVYDSYEGLYGNHLPRIVVMSDGTRKTIVPHWEWDQTDTSAELEYFEDGEGNVVETTDVVMWRDVVKDEEREACGQFPRIRHCYGCWQYKECQHSLYGG